VPAPESLPELAPAALPSLLSLEAELPPALADKLLRIPALAALREGRSRSAALVLTWLDTADGVLAQQGLVLEEPRRGPRRLLRSLPEEGAPWQPGGLPELVAELAPGEVPESVGMAALIPYAAFDGRRTVVPLRGGVEAVLLAGRLRAVADEAQVLRLQLSGPAEAVLASLAALAEEVPALPPRAALPEMARALARIEPLRPRRLAAPILDPAMDVEGALRLLIGHLAEVLIWHTPGAAAGVEQTGVHQMRVAIRRLRSALRAFRPAADGPSLRRFDEEARILAAVLGPARDWDVFLAGLGAELSEALPEEPRIAQLIHAAEGKREAAYTALRATLSGAGYRRLLWDAVRLVETAPWRAEGDAEAADRRARGLTDFAAGVIEKRWRKLTEVGAEIGHLPDDEFHALRLEGKRVRYVAELFAPLWAKKRGRRFLARLAEVQEAFGLANDAAVARALVAPLAGRGNHGATAWAVGVAEGWALARARRARSRAAAAWEDMLAGEPFWSQG
jgi:CHAD domain-containing protein